MSCLDHIGLLTKHTSILFYQAVVVAGSNHQPHRHFAYAKHTLSKVGSLIELPLITMPDYTKKTCILYHNQALIFRPNSFTHLNQSHAFESFLKDIEKQCLRKHGTPQISLDLDILLLQSDDWYAIKERYPFKHHELCCLGFARPSTV